MQHIQLAITNGKPTTTSLQIAETFNKQHGKVLRAITSLECSPEFTEANFGLSEYVDSTGRKLPAFTITRDGFTFLAMGFTGKKAAVWKEAFIKAFNDMERALLSQASSKPDPVFELPDTPGQGPRALLTKEEKASLQKRINNLVLCFTYQGAAYNAIWCAIRADLRLPSPYPLEQRHIPQVVATLKRLEATATQAARIAESTRIKIEGMAIGNMRTPPDQTTSPVFRLPSM
jgi:Rha family phage regulatory protein